MLVDIVKCHGKSYEVNTILMTDFERFLNPMLDLRNDMFGIKSVGETMIWQVDENNTRIAPILHCERYSEVKSIKPSHLKIVNEIKSGNTNFFNGDGFPLCGKEAKDG